MPNSWHRDERLLNSVSSNLLNAMSMFPKRLLHVDELIHRFSMPLSQMLMLAMIEKEPMSIGRISSRMGIAKPNITPLVDALLARGYVRRVRNGADRRVVYVEVLDPGRACLDEIRAVITDQIREWPAGVSRADVEHLDRHLDGLTRFMERNGDG